MKLSSKVLAGSLASAGMVLSLVAPALTAQAATTSGEIGSDGKTVVASTPQDKEIGALEGNKDLAIAFDGTDGNALATAKSNASVKVVNGILILDRVPDFNFGAAASGTVKGLADNTRDAGAAKDAVDGNEDGVLQVTESRSALSGFTLSASLGSFLDSDGKAVTGTGTGTGVNGKDFILHLASQGLTVNNTAQEGFKSEDASITSSETAATAPDYGTAVIKATKGEQGYTTGTIAATFDSAKTAQLTVPTGIGDGTKPTVQSLNSTITWTLNAKPSADAGAGEGA